MKTELSVNNDFTIITVLSMTEDSSNTNPNLPLIVVVFKFLRRSAEGKHLMCSQSETPLASRGRGVIIIGCMHINPIASLIPVKMTGI